MGDRNSLSVYTDLLYNVYLDVVDCMCLNRAESAKDLIKIQRRISAEGISFLTKFLPACGKAFDKALQTGTFTPQPGLERAPGSQLPKLFGGLLSKVFDCTGRLLVAPDTSAIKHVRCLYYLMYKLRLPHDKQTEEKLLDAFIQVDTSLEDVSIPNGHKVTVYAQRLAIDVFGRLDPLEIVPRHGPGAVSTGEEVHKKHFFTRLYSRLETVYPFTEYMVLGLTQVVDEYHCYPKLQIHKTAEAKIVLVPKDSRGPRVISCEPLEVQWIQQGLGNKIRDHLEKHRLTRGQVNFTDQNVNRQLALTGSKTQEWVTLDMKEASDRVSIELVNTIFGTMPNLAAALYACRSEVTRLPDGRKHEMRKFAPMGSNLCFPVEAFIFYSLSVAAIMYVYGVSRFVARRSVYVYGDDIIVRSKYYAAVLQWLPEFGLMFNSDKCCVAGSFRESCGCDAFNGVDVTPLRLKSTWCTRDRLDARTMASYVGFAASLHARGYGRAYAQVKRLVERKLGPLPVTSKEASGLCWVERDATMYEQVPGVRYRFNKALHRLEALSYRIRPLTVKSSADNWSSVLRTLLCGSSGSSPGVYARPRRSCLKRGWIPV